MGEQPLQDVTIINRQRIPGMNGGAEIAAGLTGEEGQGDARRVEIRNNVARENTIEGDQSEVGVAERNPRVVFAEIYIPRDLRKICRPQLLALEAMPDLDGGAGL